MVATHFEPSATLGRGFLCADSVVGVDLSNTAKLAAAKMLSSISWTEADRMVEGSSGNRRPRPGFDSVSRPGGVVVNTSAFQAEDRGCEPRPGYSCSPFSQTRNQWFPRFEIGNALIWRKTPPDQKVKSKFASGIHAHLHLLKAERGSSVRCFSFSSKAKHGVRATARDGSTPSGTIGFESRIAYPTNARGSTSYLCVELRGNPS